MADVETSDEWSAYCPVCEEYVYEPVKNGAMAEAGAEKHVEETGHEVIVGQTYRGGGL